VVENLFRGDQIAADCDDCLGGFFCRTSDSSPSLKKLICCVGRQSGVIETTIEPTIGKIRCWWNEGDGKIITTSPLSGYSRVPLSGTNLLRASTPISATLTQILEEVNRTTR
jgi:hypothetical protein